MGFKLTTLVVICTGSCKSNYHTITTTMAPLIYVRFQSFSKSYINRSKPVALNSGWHRLINSLTPLHILLSNATLKIVDPFKPWNQRLEYVIKILSNFLQNISHLTKNMKQAISFSKPHLLSKVHILQDILLRKLDKYR